MGTKSSPRVTVTVPWVWAKQSSSIQSGCSDGTAMNLEGGRRHRGVPQLQPRTHGAEGCFAATCASRTVPDGVESGREEQLIVQRDAHIARLVEGGRHRARSPAQRAAPQQEQQLGCRTKHTAWAPLWVRGAAGRAAGTRGGGAQPSLTDHHHVIPAVVAADGEVQPSGSLRTDHQRDVPADVLQRCHGPRCQKPQRGQQQQPQSPQHAPAGRVGHTLRCTDQERPQHPAGRRG